MPQDSQQVDPVATNAQTSALIAAGFTSNLLLPGSPSYTSRLNSWWSLNSRLQPSCIIQPHSALEISKILQTLTALGPKNGTFAIRSGGHTPWPGGSNIQNGVVIDLKYLNQTTYNASTKIASLGPAQTWSSAFLALEKEGVMVAGGRDGNVGVGGLLTGGGNSFYTGRHGFVCDGLVNAEVVLGDGSIVNANAEMNADLWRALKGGIGNFGVVTRFDVQAFEAGKLWGGMRASGWEFASAVSEALVNFTDRTWESPQAAFIVDFTFQPSLSRDLVVVHVLVDTDGASENALFDEVRGIPELFSDISKRTMSNIANAYMLPADLRNVWFTRSFKNDVRVVQRSAELLQAFTTDMLEIVPSDDLVTQSLWQPIPKMFADIGVTKGGNVMGLDKNEGNTLLWLCAASVKSAKHESLMHRKASAMEMELQKYAKSIDATSPWIYINYADPSQKSLESYGAENIAFMREVSAKYDPLGVFQKLVTGSFRISKVGVED